MKRIVLAALVLGGLLTPALHGQVPVLPSSISPNEVEIRMTRRAGGGCYGRCLHYRVTISGDGTVRYEDLASPPVPQRIRRVAVDEVVALANEFVRARFLEAHPVRYVGESFYVLQNGQLVLHGSGAIDIPIWDLSFRLGTLENSVHLEHGIPNHLGRLRDLVDKLGGPKLGQDGRSSSRTEPPARIYLAATSRFSLLGPVLHDDDVRGRGGLLAFFTVS